MTMTASDLYEPMHGHKPLRFIRLLPHRDFEADIHVDLVSEHMLHPMVLYEACSYSWGDPNHVEEIWCNATPVGLRRNACNFLRRLRLPSENRLLWMDCICIDQTNLQERAQQVAMMHEIYRYAASVMVWLGPAQEDSDLAMDIVSNIDPTDHIEDAMRYMDSPNWADKSFYFDGQKGSAEEIRTANALVALIERPWTKRVWIQQEAAMCRDTRILCGSKEATWDQFFSLVWLLLKRTSLGWPSWIPTDDSANDLSMTAMTCVFSSRMHQFRMVPTWQHGFRSQGSRSTPSTILTFERTWGCQATDPRDKVFAIFNLFSPKPDELARRPSIDYTISWQLLYMKTAQWLISYQLTRPLSVLSHAGRTRQQALDLPSWVPDWRVFVDDTLPQHRQWFAGGGAMFKNGIRFMPLPKSANSEEQCPRYVYDDMNDVQKLLPAIGMQVAAILQDRIVFLSETNITRDGWITDDPVKIDTEVRRCLSFVESKLGMYMTGESAREAFAATYIAGSRHDDGLSGPEYEKGLDDYLEWLAHGAVDTEPDYALAAANSRTLTENAFAVTAQGLMCLVPKITRVGDYVAVLMGGQDPISLHRVLNSQGHYYEHLGRCYIHRMMRGRCWALIEEFRCKYRQGSEDSDREECESGSSMESNLCGFFPFNDVQDYVHVRKILGKRLIMLV